MRDPSRDDRSPPTWWAAEVESRAEGLRGGPALSALMHLMRAASAANRALSRVRSTLRR